VKKEDYYSKTFMERYKKGDRNLEDRLEDREKKALKLLSGAKLSTGSKIIDVGCGDGFLLQELAKTLGRDCEYFGGEYSDFQRIKAEERTGFSISSIDLEESLDFRDGTFDVIYSGEVIEHLFNPDKMVRELNRICKPGGLLVITTPNMNSWISRILFVFGFQPINYECSTECSAYGYRGLKKFKRQDWPVGHVRLFNCHSISDLLEGNGFQILTIQGSVFESIPKPLRGFDRFFARSHSLASGIVVLAKRL
jgi:SAM-dependent methyltransferase